MHRLFIGAAFIGAVLALNGCAKQNDFNANCFVPSVRGVVHGNFSKVALPNFVGGDHMRSGQYLVVNSGVCSVGGAPSGPQF